MSAPPSSSNPKLVPGPSTPLPNTPASQNETPRSHPTSNLAKSPANRTPIPPGSGDSRSPTTHNVATAAMQRTGSANMLSPAGGPQQMQRVPGKSVGLGTPRLGTSGKTVPGMSSAGKTLPPGHLALRPDTPSGGTNTGSSPGLSSLGGGSLNGLPGFDSPALAGLTGTDMSFGLSNLSNLPLGVSLSNLGSMGGKIDDGERRRRLEMVLDVVRKRPGRISREALERLGRRCEMDIMHDGADKLSLAGKNAVLIDLQYKPSSSNVERVSVHFPTASEELSAHADEASRIMHSDLSPPEGTAAINATLKRFADNLERLARMDKLSLEDTKTNCFEAVFGVYKSLKRLYEQEKGAAERLMSSSGKDLSANAELEVMCKKSGRPRMHARRRVGLSLEYWKQRRHVSKSNKDLAHDADAMDLDEAPALGISNDEDDIQSLTIECEHCPPALYQPIRTTSSWLSERVLKPPEQDKGPDEGPESGAIETDAQGQQAEPIIEWLDPETSFQPLLGEAAGVGRTRPPHARFVAYLEPPIVLPAQVASQLYASLDTDINGISGTLAIAPYTALVLENVVSREQAIGQTITVTRPILSTPIPGEEEKEETYTVTLNPTPTSADTAVRIEKLPFSHPRQLIAILPTLRQYALLSRVLTNSFTPSSSSSPAIVTDASTSTAPTANSAPAEDLDALLAAFLAAPPDVANTIDATLSFTPAHRHPVHATQLGHEQLQTLQPHVDVTIPTAAGLRHVRLLFCLGGGVRVGPCDVFDEMDGMDGVERAVEESERERGEKEKRERRLARGMEVAEDLGVWGVWVRRMVDGGAGMGGDGKEEAEADVEMEMKDEEAEQDE